MSPVARMSGGLAAALLFGWLWHGPLGHGPAMIDRLQRDSDAVVAAAEVPGIAVALDRAPLARAATLSGPADRFQRDGQGDYPGLTARIAGVSGIASVGWSDESARTGFALPLIVEALGLVALSYLLGLGAARLLLRRRESDGF